MCQPLFAPLAPVHGHHVQFRKLEERRDGSTWITGDGAGIGRIFKAAGPEVGENGDDGEHQGVSRSGRVMEKSRGQAQDKHAEEQAAHVRVTKLDRMLEFEMRELVSHDVIDFAPRHALEKEVRERDGVAGACEGVGDLAFSGRNEINLLELYAKALGHAKRAVAEITR